MSPASKDNGHGNTNGNTWIHEDLDCGDTQPLDPHCGGESRYFEDTVPFNDEDDDDFETQPVDLAGETQVLDFAAGETQPLDDFDGGDDDADTQLMDECSDGTQVLEDMDGDDVSHGDPQSADSKEIPRESSDKKLLGNTGVVVHEHNSSDMRPPRFTFLRAESLREAALAARNMALKRTQGETNSVTGMTQSCQEPLAVKDICESFPRCSEKVREVDQECNLGKNSAEIEAVTNKNMDKVASSAVRKLFNDDLPVEKTNVPSLCSNDFNEGEGLDRLPVYDGEFEGLSYVNSQEPGELSQVNALDVVDRFLQDIMEFDQDIDDVKNKTAVTTTKTYSTNHGKNAEEKLKFLPSAKGQQSLAKRVNDRAKDITIGIYELDDSREDEGGGDIYLRRKEDFFGGKTRRPKSLPGFQKTKACMPNDDKDGEKKSSILNRRKTAVQSDSRLGMHNVKGRDNPIKEATRKLKKNLRSEFDEQVNTNCSRGEMEPKVNADTQEVLDVGLDTQMAAEAMEALCNAEDVANAAINVTRSSVIDQLNNSSTGKVGPATSRECSRQFYKKRKVAVKSDLQTSGLSKKCAKEVKQFKRDNIRTRSKRSKLDAEGNQTLSADENGRRDSSPTIDQRKSAGALGRLEPCKLNNHDSSDRGSGRRRVNKRKLQGEDYHFTPVARRTRQSLAVNQFIQPDIPSESLREEDIGIGSLEKSSGAGLQASKALDPNSTPKAITASVSIGVEVDTVDCPRRRSRRIKKLSDHDKEPEELVGSSKPSAQPEDIGKSTAGKRKMRTGSRNVVKSHVNCQKQSSSYGGLAMSSIDQERGKILEPNLDTERPGDTPFCCNVIAEKDANQKRDGKNNADVRGSANNRVVSSLNESPRDRCESSDLAYATPANCRTPANDASPVCRGDDYYKQSCNANLSRSCLHKVLRKELQRELRSLSTIRPELTTPSKDSRKRRDMTDVRVLYSHRLDEDIIKHQKKILARLGVSVASSIADATHFIADQFVRTRNMLEAIAFGKPVVTHLWIESCGQASCFIDEKNYLLRDAKKEKEFGFSMPVSLARASHHPLLEDRRVLITPNTKPSKEVISSLVKAVQGQAVERLGRSVLKDNKIPDDLLILSCEEDYASCVPFLEKGAMVYSSELLLNGIVIQKLEYERHRLFADHVKKTRSTIWLKKKDDRIFLPVTKCI